jgi:hypothetical protein
VNGGLAAVVMAAVMLATPSAAQVVADTGVIEAKEPEAPAKLEGARYEEFLRMQLAAMAARVEYLDLVAKSQQTMLEAMNKGKAVEDAERALGAWVLDASGGRKDCLPQADGAWVCK